MPSDTESSAASRTPRRQQAGGRALPDAPIWTPHRPTTFQSTPSASRPSSRPRIESSMSVASSTAGPYTATLRPTSAYGTYDQSRRTSAYAGAAAAATGRMGYLGAEHPGLQNRQSFTLLAKQDLERAEVFAIIHRIRRDIKKCIETALSYEQINSPRLVFSVMRPLQDAYMNLNSPCTIYALLLNRVYFSQQTYTLSSLSVNNTRAMVCEILAIKILRALYEEDTSENGVFRLAILLASSFSPFQGAPDWALPEDLDPKYVGSATEAAINDRKISSSALELAIVSEAKRFIRAVPTQRVILDIWRGKIVYSSMSFRYIIKDQYKRRPIMKYNPRNAPLLDHYRLRVPRIRAALEWLHFTILFASYLVVLKTMNKHRMNGYEIFWVVYGFGFALDKVASLLELGWTVFTSNLWNGLDFVFVIMFLLYLPLRIIGLKNDHQLASTEALSILTCAGTILFPRFAFVTLSDNLLILSLRSMLAQFGKLMLLAVWCFAGFFVAILTLSHGKYKPWEIVQWMVWIWFGLDATGLVEATRVHNVLGPVLMVIYACLSNTLLLTVLVSILSNTFNLINSDATAEQMYRKAVSTFQGNKSDGIFSFQPPINILALAILLPCRPFVDAHQYHKIIVFLARATNLPLLLLIHAVERYVLFIDHQDRPEWMKLHTYTFGLSGWWSGTRTNLDDVFEYEEDIDEDILPESVFHTDLGTSRPPSPEPAKHHHVDEPTEMDARLAEDEEESRDKKQKQEEEERAELERLKRKRRTHSMSDWGGGLAGNGSTIKARPALLSKLYAPRERDTLTKESWKTFFEANLNSGNGSGVAQEEIDELKDRLQRIEDGQRRIEEALKGLGDSGD